MKQALENSLAIIHAHRSKGLINRLKARAWWKARLWVQPEVTVLEFDDTHMYLEDFQGLVWGHLEVLGVIAQNNEIRPNRS